MKEKLLIIRFSSFGDLFHCLGVPAAFKARYPNAEVEWAIRQDFAQLLEDHRYIDKLWALDRTLGLPGLWKLAGEIRRSQISHVYDAHNNLRSILLVFFLRALGARFRLIRRSKQRIKRLLLFRFGINKFPQPFVSQISFIKPLRAWGLNKQPPPPPQFFPKSESEEKLTHVLKGFATSFVALVPSAAWRMKRWPIEHWQELIKSLPQTNFVLLGGKQDVFCQKIADIAPDRTLNLAGKLSLRESADLLVKAQAVVSADTGLMHVADQLGKPLICLIGPTAFGFPASPSAHVVEVNLECRPCSKDGSGRCHNKIYQRCMKEISPENVKTALQSLQTEGH